MNQIRIWTLVTLLACALLGCGDGIDRVPINGTLTSMGSIPVDNAVLVFIPGAGTLGEGAIGQTDAAGNFTVISSRARDAGIPPGKYRVRVSRLIDEKTKDPIPAGAPEADFPNAVESIPPPFAGVNSPLETEISAGGALAIDIPKKLKGQ